MRLFFNSWLFVFIFFVAVMGAWIIGLIYLFPFRYWWFDVVMHFLGGLWVVSFVTTMENHYLVYFTEKNHHTISLIILLSFVVFIGVLWEFFEFVADRFIFKTGFTFMQGVYEDTLNDLFIDIVGGAIGALAYLFYNKKTNA